MAALIMAGALMLAGHAAWARDNQDQPQQQRRLFGILPPQAQQRQPAAPQYQQGQNAPRGYQDYGQDPRRYQGAYGDLQADPRYAQPRYVDPRYGGYGQAQVPQNQRNDGRYPNDPYARGYGNDGRAYQDPRYAAPRGAVDDNRSRSLLPGLLAPRQQRDSRQENYGGMSSDQAAREVQSRHGGRVLSVQPDGSSYRVKTLKDGEVRIYQVYP